MLNSERKGREGGVQRDHNSTEAAVGKHAADMVSFTCTFMFLNDVVLFEHSYSLIVFHHTQQ